jgi:radical SAM superfamily enzyme YgiQ (UPF0313 family)
MADFIDCFLIGEAETMLASFFEAVAAGRLDSDRQSLLKALARNVPGAYVPAFYRTRYHPDGTLKSFEPTTDVPAQIERVFTGDLSNVPTCSAVITPETTFDQKYLVEVSRGCPHGCRFCSTGFIYRPPRFRPLTLLESCLENGGSTCDQIGLVGAAVSDLPDLDKLCSHALQSGTHISFSSLRADALTTEIIDVLRKSNVKTATIAPDAGSRRMRRVINKGIDEDDILNAAENLVAGGIG